ncbi:uncharacterized protein LOC129614142 [Condylostylus longicornis]|uniref:uncharacterized protein LOC129614142 n=1 Tax=Condylostylus longicornis TaxID=2530218 RepID=UPI00244DBF56|nr:uncharacterized protein LOC129614142 [Condylostylus longicornis]
MAARINSMHTRHPIFNDDNFQTSSDTNDIYGLDKKIQDDGMKSHPGTNWCGRKGTSRDYNDLGEHRETDKCCRDHYHCDNIPSGEELNNIVNSIIFPGTKWCGPGDIAEGYDDLGIFKETDMCCRDHDHCDHIPAGEEKCGIENKYYYTRLHCKCDKNFFECLHKSTDIAAYFVGQAYFGVSGQCFRKDYPIKDCIEYESVFPDKRCVKYSYNENEPQFYQWFDLPYYFSKKFPDLNGSENGNVTDFKCFFDDTDACCRAHDHCDHILAGKSKCGLQNKGLYTRLHCECDKEFFECLHKVDSLTSNLIGKIYFTITKQCYRKDYPIIKCKESVNILTSERCIEYIYDKSKSKIFQWFDLPFYKLKVFPNLNNSTSDESENCSSFSFF